MSICICTFFGLSENWLRLRCNVKLLFNSLWLYWLNFSKFTQFWSKYQKIFCQICVNLFKFDFFTFWNLVILLFISDKPWLDCDITIHEAGVIRSVVNGEIDDTFNSGHSSTDKKSTKITKSLCLSNDVRKQLKRNIKMVTWADNLLSTLIENKGTKMTSVLWFAVHNWTIHMLTHCRIPVRFSLLI